jgi:hypothetical protein
MQLRDNALTRSRSKSRGLAAGRWWRWTRYELRDGYLRPAPGARLRVYDPWKLWLKTRPVARRSDQEDHGGTPYRALLEMLHKLEYRKDSGKVPEFTPAQVDMLIGPLTADSEQTILDWCAKYGLLGILPHRVLQVVLPAQAGCQVRYDRIGIGWVAAEREARNPVSPILEPRAIVQPLRGVGLAVEPLTKTWARFFPDVPVGERDTFAYPEPLADSFWESYAEPLQDFLSGARALRELLIAIRVQRTSGPQADHAALSGGLPIVVSALAAPAGLGAELGKPGRIGLNWVGNSLLASLTMMLLEDLSGGRALQCQCGQLFVSHAYQARYCSRRCRWRFEQRESRKKRPKRRTLSL